MNDNQSNKNIHDNFVKKALSNKTVAKEFFETNLPREILSQINLTTLKQEKESYFDNILRSWDSRLDIYSKLWRR